MAPGAAQFTGTCSRLIHTSADHLSKKSLITRCSIAARLLLS